MKEPGLIYTVIFTFIVCFVFVFVLSLTNQATIAIVERNETIKRQMALLTAMGMGGLSEAEIETAFEAIEQFEYNGATIYKSEVNGQTILAKQFAGPGLWGTIYGAIGVDPQANRISGIEIINHNETPGLGARIDQPWFKDQIRGELIVNDQITMKSRRGVGDSDKENGNIDGVSGATRTSESITVIINNEVNELLQALGG